MSSYSTVIRPTGHCSKPEFEYQEREMSFSWNSVEEREKKKYENEKNLKQFLLSQQEEMKKR